MTTVSVSSVTNTVVASDDGASLVVLVPSGNILTQNIDNTATGYFKVPVGTTAERPNLSAQGMIRFNTSRGCFEGYTGSSWVNISPETVDDVGAT